MPAFKLYTMDPDKLIIVKAVGKVLRELRLSQNLTIEQVANLSGLEYSQVSRIERGKINTSVYHLILILTTLKVSPDQAMKHLQQQIKSIRKQEPVG